MKIALDAMGGDFAPSPNIAGAIRAIERQPELHVVLVGDLALLESELNALGGVPDRITLAESDGVVGMDEKPTVALRAKPNCSIARCWQLMAQGPVDAIVSAGNTGAIVASGLRTRLFLKGVKRPGIAVTLPTPRGPCVLVDVGANPAARPEHLFQYGLMGSIFAREMLKIPAPRLGLMNIGSEEGKGNDLYRQTNEFLNSSRLKDSYVGNVEGRGLYQGEADVLICEAFVGNVVLKVSEGMAEFLLNTVGKSVLKSLDAERGLAAKALNEVTQQFRHQESGGAPLLGIDGICMICHGSSDADSICNALIMATQMDEHHINAQIVEQLAQQATATG
jgi:phosphate acyltransferase